MGLQESPFEKINDSERENKQARRRTLGLDAPSDSLAVRSRKVVPVEDATVWVGESLDGNDDLALKKV